MLQGCCIGTNLNGPSWSISTELVVYLLFPVFVYLMLHRRTAAWISDLAVAIGVLCWLASLHPGLGPGSEVIGDQPMGVSTNSQSAWARSVCSAIRGLPDFSEATVLHSA